MEGFLTILLVLIGVAIQGFLFAVFFRIWRLLEEHNRYLAAISLNTKFIGENTYKAAEDQRLYFEWQGSLYQQKQER